MLAPPPEGTFDIDHERLPLKSSTAKSDGPPEQAPLIAQEEEDENHLEASSNSGKSKVRFTVYSTSC